ncbi:hypothetical protein BRADI_2g27176v3 [Brachypodium distachyon]|uniref:Uncharacterized protein n=1 Tax=Brachypodium distachyon TaxID=15368 RepID=A0A0Q3G5G3_BRADI|nr:hypothetical protein BRADI_2g27176v3 [Brachypodium distachyon]
MFCVNQPSLHLISLSSLSLPRCLLFPVLPTRAAAATAASLCATPTACLKPDQVVRPRCLPLLDRRGIPPARSGPPPPPCRRCCLPLLDWRRRPGGFGRPHLARAGSGRPGRASERRPLRPPAPGSAARSILGRPAVRARRLCPDPVGPVRGRPATSSSRGGRRRRLRPRAPSRAGRPASTRRHLPSGSLPRASGSSRSRPPCGCPTLLDCGWIWLHTDLV